MGNNKVHTSRYAKDTITKVGPIVNGSFRCPSGTPNKYVMALRKFIKTPLEEHWEHNLLVNRVITNLTDDNYISESEILLLLDCKLIIVENGQYKLTI